MPTTTKRQSAYTRKCIHILDIEIRECIDELDLEIGESVHKLPAAAGIGKRIDTLHVQVAKSRNDRHPEVGKGIDDLNLAIQIFPFISAILADFAGKRRGGGKSQTQGTGRYDKKVAYFHGRQVNK